MNQEPMAPRADMTAAPQAPRQKEPAPLAMKRWRMHPLAAFFPSGYPLLLAAVALLLAVTLLLTTVLTVNVCITEGDFRWPSFKRPGGITLNGVAGEEGDRPFADGQSGDVLLSWADHCPIIREDKITSKNAVLASLSSGEIIASRKADDVIYPASLTKVMTLIVVVENLPREECLQDPITVSQEVNDAMVAAGASRYGMEVGAKYSVEAMLYALMLRSDGVAATELAKYVAGSEEDFVELMNQKAEKMGLKNTHFENPTGLHHNDHKSSCRDVATIMAYAMNMELCRKILKTVSYTTYCTNPNGEQERHTFYNKLTDELFKTTAPNQPTGVTVVAGKTGFTDESRFCLVTYAESKDGRGYVCVTASAGSYKECLQDYIYIYNTYAK